jgi:hypothetical protein
MLVFWINLMPPSSGCILGMKMDVARLCNPLGMIYQTTQHDIPENGNPEKVTQ